MLAGVSSRTRYPWLDDGTAYVGKESSLHSPIPGTELLVDETIADENTIDDVLENNRSTSLVRNALRSSNISLTDKERIILHMRFGIDCQEKTLNEIGADFGVSRERIRQIEAIALGKIEIYLRRHQKR
jgi:RNA polymerase sigma factor (sigma-70 family)